MHELSSAQHSSILSDHRPNGRGPEPVDMLPGVNVSGLESDGRDQFFCGGGRNGKVRAVRRPSNRGRSSS